MNRKISLSLAQFLLVITMLVTPGYAHTQIVSKTTIIYNGPADPAITDLKTHLANYQVGNIKISKTSLDNRTGQEFYLSIKGNQTEILYTTNNSLQNAVYTYLDLLGFRWYGPTELWQVSPKTIRMKDLAGRWYTPSFRNRQFFGTGGLDFGTMQSYDPDNLYKKEWYAFKRRNRFNADFVSGGHMGTNFYLDNKAELDLHPEWFANEQGKRTGRLKIEKAEAVNLFKKYVGKVASQNNSDFSIVNVDPEDGRGGIDDPLPPKNFAGIKSWNSADKWWWLANEVAKDYGDKNKKIVVSMYAYGDGKENALAPKFPLRSNVYPIIIPYAFQKAYTPIEMIKTWASRSSGNMGIYDYWNITQWSEGLPQFNIRAIPEKLRFWNKYKIDGVYLETTDAFGPMGPALWLAGQMQWDVDKNFDQLFDKFFEDCFGEGAASVKKMYSRWSSNYQGAAEVAFSLDNLKEASSFVAPNSKEAMRINSLKAYVHFMKLFYEHNGSKNSRDQIYQYVYSIHSLMLVQTAAFVGQQYVSPGGVAPLPLLKEPISATQIEINFQKDLKESFNPYPISNFVFDLDKVIYVEPLLPDAWLFGRFQAKFFFKSPINGEISFDVGSTDKTTFIFISDKGNVLNDNIGEQNYSYKDTVTANRHWFMKRLKVSVTKGATYNIISDGTFNRLKLNTPGIVLFKIPGEQDFDNYNYPLQYFYVPKGTKEIVFYDAEKEGTNGSGFLIAPDGSRTKREKIGVVNIYKVKVENGWDGKLWSAAFGHTGWSFKNIPNFSSLQKFGYEEN